MDRKKLSAAIAGVTAYIITCEETQAAGMVQTPDTIAPEAIERTAGRPVNLWGVSGRQHTMQMRGLMQMKSFHRIKT